YAPAEQYTAAAANQGPWTDLYALGAVIFRCLTGAEPTDSTERQDTITNGEPAPLVPKLRNLAGVASPGLAKAVEGCLRVARKDRIQGVAELRQVLNNRLTPNPESIKPTPVREETETTPGHRSNGYAYVSSQDQNLEFQMSFPLATRWPRFFARIFDVWLEIMLVSIVLGVVLGYYSAGFIEWINDPGGSLFLGIICLPIGLMLDAAVYRLIGNTPGKALLGLKVSTLDGRALSFGQYLYRNFSIWIAGLAFGLPIIYLITMARQGQRLARGQQTSYDESTGYRVRAKQIGWIRRLGFGLVFTGLLLVMAVFNSMEKAAQREQILSSISPDYSWENPITRINAKIGSQWKNSTQQNDDGQPVYMFSERTGHAVIILALESVSGFTLNDYVQGFQKNTTAHMRFSDGGRFSEKNNSPVWQGSGRMVDTSGSRLNVQIMQVGSDFWRVVTIQVMPYDYSDRLVAQLQAELWMTVK
ncbi:MAG: RDD family protein, partial [Candidatus Adiutrix sp.]|nr:RDD family protein [Candidatus Adiutrix sp.]